MFTHLWSRRKVLLTSGLLLAGLALCCPTTSANAGPVKKQPKREPQQVSNAQLREGLNVLQVTKKMLQAADHDYGGHRVAAVKAIDTAERQLKLALHSQAKKAPGGKTSGKAKGPGAGRGRQPEPQNLSNLQLADAIVILERTRIFLQKADHDYGGHRAAAVRDLGGAVKQLKTALRFEKKTKG
ncbi:MAG TPA: hypothetical protein VMG10_02185 [Gemmataceae bacterium]|nr:hypothetical protein [Gemmataceae bacterium]